MNADYVAYEKALCDQLWAWAKRHHKTHLDGVVRPNRPPVLAEPYAQDNILVPPDDGRRARQIRQAIDSRHRHKWFASLKSSQALSQSVFAALVAYNRLHLLSGLVSECGRPAYFTDCSHVRLLHEYEVNWLGEPRPTSLDVLLKGPHGRIAVECKFTETAFGTCSRPRLEPQKSGYCDGSYTVQNRRKSRCALSERGIKYWEFLPALFDWPVGRDHRPCPFKDSYQIARNALAVRSTPSGLTDTGHVLVVYDARNPSFWPGGQADQQWQHALKACLQPGLLRRLSWQALISVLSHAPELGWLQKDLKAKYGLAAGQIKTGM